MLTTDHDDHRERLSVDARLSLAQIEDADARGTVARAVAAVLGRIETLADTVAAECLRQVPEYKRRQEPALSLEIEVAFTRHARLLLGHLASGRSPSPETLDLLAELGARRRSQGIPLPALQLAYQIGTQVVWRELLNELQAENEGADAFKDRMVDLTGSVFTLSTQATGALSRRYVEGSRCDCRDEEVAFEALLRGGLNSHELRSRLATLGFVPGAYHVVVVITLLGSTTPPHAIREAAKRLRSIRQSRDASITLSPEDDRLVAIIGLPDPGSYEQLVDAITGVLTNTGSDNEHPIAGVGRAEAGVLGIPISHRQASQALELRKKMSSGPQVMTYEAHLPYAMLASSPPLMDELLRGLEPLLRTGDDDDLIRSLEAYLATGGRQMKAAKMLNVSRRTLYRRLDLIAELLACDLEDGQARAILDLALRALRLLPA